MSTVDDIARADGVTSDELRASLANAVDHAKSTGMTDEEFVLWIWHAGFVAARLQLAEQEPTEREALAEVLNRWATGPALAQMVVAEVRGALRRDETEQEPSDAEVEAAARGLYENHVSQIESEQERASWPAWEDHEQADADEWRDEARAALRAAARVRKGQG